MGKGGSMKKKWIAVVLSLLCVMHAAAKPRSVRGSEQHKTQETYTVEPFDRLLVNGQVEVEFTQAPEGTYTVSFSGPYNLANLLEIKSEWGTLHIHYKEPIAVLGDDHLRIKVAAPDLSRIEIQNSGEVHIHTPLAVQEIQLLANGKSEIEIDDLQAQMVQTEMHGESEVDILKMMCQTLHVKALGKSTFDAQHADCDMVVAMAYNRAEISVTGLNGQSVTAENYQSSETELKGMVANASLTARGRSQIDAKGLQAAEATVLADHSAHIGVRVAGILNADAQDRSVVKYKGWPQQINRTGKGTVAAD